MWFASKGAWKAIEEQAPIAVMSSSTPTSATAGDIWIDTNESIAYVYYDDGNSAQWVELLASPSTSSGGGSGGTVNNIDDIVNVNVASATDGNALVYDTSTSSWIANKDTDIIKLNGQSIPLNYTMPSGYNGVSSGPITIANGVVVTIPDGSVWSIV